MTTRTNNAEGQASGTTVTTGNSGGASGDAWSAIGGSAGVCTFSNAQAAHGGQSYLFNNSGTENPHLRWTGLSGPSAAVSFALYLVSAPTAIADWCHIRSGSNVVKLQMSTSGQLRVVNLGGSLVKTFTAFSTSTWYTVDLYTAKGTGTGDGTIKCQYRLLNSMVPVEAEYSSTTTNAGTANFDAAWFGKLDAAPVVNMYLDDLRFSDTATGYFGPFIGDRPTTVGARNSSVAFGAPNYW